MKIIKTYLKENQEVTLTGYLQEPVSSVVNRPAILILPGGGYKYCSKRENEPVVSCYLKAGFQVFVLEYSVLEAALWPEPLNDYTIAMEHIMHHLEEYQIEKGKIALIGFSAGGHLAAVASSVSKFKPTCTILGYPVILKETVNHYLSSAPDASILVNPATPPHFIFASRTDSSVPITNTLKYLEALEQNKISFETHIYAYAPHGFSVCTPEVQDMSTVCSRTPDWVSDSIQWLEDVFGKLADGKFLEPRIK